MRFDTSQQMKLGQQMKLSPRMIQSMEILQMPLLALQERVDQELESNIALEVAEPESTESEGGAAESVAEGQEMVVGEAGDGADDFERLSDLERDYSDAVDNEYSSSSYSATRHAGERDRKMDAMANLEGRGESLGEQLLHQWTFAEVDDDTAAIGVLLIHFITMKGCRSDLERYSAASGAVEAGRRWSGSKRCCRSCSDGDPPALGAGHQVSSSGRCHV